MIEGTDVTLELRVRSMEHTILQALTLYEGKLNEEIKGVVHAVVNGFDFNGELERELKYEVQSQLRQMCKDAIQGRVRNLLQERIDKAISELEKQASGE